MRFLIDVTDFRRQLHGKYNRVLRALAAESGTNSGILVNISGGEIRSLHQHIIDNAEFHPLWATAPWRCVTRVEESQQVGKLMASFIGARLFNKSISTERKHDLSWTFANCFECFPLWLRLRLARFLEIERNGKSREMFHHWLSERGAGFPQAAERDDPSEPLHELSERDTLVLAGASWGHVEMDALKVRKNATGFKLVCLIYDLLPIDYPSIVTVRQYIEYKIFLMGVGLNADLILTANGFSAARIKEFFKSVGVDVGQRVACLPVSGAALRSRNGKLSKRMEDLGLHRRPFILCQSALRERKHVLWLYALCAKLYGTREGFPLLVIAGRADDLRVLRILVEAPTWGETGVFIEIPMDDELVWLYEHARLCLYPSFEGGLGMSVMEAVDYGRPCIAADAPSLVEASRGLAVHLPRDETLWADAICRALDEGSRANCTFRPPSTSESNLLPQIMSHLHQRTNPLAR